MIANQNIVLHIPAREGSKRVPQKNIRLMNGKPMIDYAINAAIGASITKNIYVNTDSEEIEKYVNHKYENIKIYKRESDLSNDNASSDEFNFDIINKLRPDILIMINPVCPLITSEDIKSAFDYFLSSEYDTLISCNSTKMQSFCDANPINININEQLAPSQNNKTVHILNWAITIWDANKFVDRMKKNGFAVLGENRFLYTISDNKSIKVSEEKDFLFAENLLKLRMLYEQY
jgi:CMP-N-acetylneuraminic acid synthetase